MLRVFFAELAFYSFLWTLYIWEVVWYKNGFLLEIDQNKDRMLEILEGKGLSFLFPLLKLEKELLKQIKLDPSPQTIYKWIKDNISPKLHVDKGFVNILMTR